MRAAGLIILASSNPLNAVHPGDEKSFRILTLGESTSADFFASDGAWPRLLEKKLRGHGLNARVYNEAVGGTSTPIILSHVDEQIERYHPDLVISMMGVNDHLNMHYDGSAKSKFYLFISRLRLVQLARWSGNTARSLWYCKFEPVQTWLWIDHGPEIEKGEAAAAGHTAEGTEEILRAEFPDTRIRAFVLNAVGRRLRDAGRAADDRGMQERGQTFVDLAFDLYPYSWHTAVFEFERPELLSRERLRHAVDTVLKCGGNIPDVLLSYLFNASDTFPELTRDAAFSARGFQFMGSASPTAYHYRLLHEILARRRIRWIAMQYPTLPVQRLQSYFYGADGKIEPQFRDVIFVSNQENFDKALSEHSYGEVFIDHQSGSWGHATDLGHDLLAESAAKAVLELNGGPAAPSAAR